MSVAEPTALTTHPVTPAPVSAKSAVARFLKGLVKFTVNTIGFAFEPRAVVSDVGTPVTESIDGGPISTLAVTVCEDTKDDPPGMPPYSTSAKFMLPMVVQSASAHFPGAPVMRE